MTKTQICSERQNRLLKQRIILSLHLVLPNARIAVRLGRVIYLLGALSIERQDATDVVEMLYLV